jgi:hypothetical protein
MSDDDEIGIELLVEQETRIRLCVDKGELGET